MSEPESAELVSAIKNKDSCAIDMIMEHQDFGTRDALVGEAFGLINSSHFNPKLVSKYAHATPGYLSLSDDLLLSADTTLSEVARSAGSEKVRFFSWDIDLGTNVYSPHMFYEQLFDKKGAITPIPNCTVS